MLQTGYENFTSSCRYGAYSGRVALCSQPGEDATVAAAVVGAAHQSVAFFWTGGNGGGFSSLFSGAKDIAVWMIFIM